MLTNDLTVTDNGSGTKPGSVGALTYALRGTDLKGSTRSVAAVAATTPKILTIQHQDTGTGFNQRLRSVVKHSYKKLDSDLADTGGVTPSSSVHIVIDRPVNSGGAITTAVLKEQIGAVLDVIMAAGQLDKILNQEI
jgi:hypothetical protein